MPLEQPDRLGGRKVRYVVEGMIGWNNEKQKVEMLFVIQGVAVDLFNVHKSQCTQK